MQRISDEHQAGSQAIVNELWRRLNAVAGTRRDRIEETRGRHWIGWRSARRDRVFAEVRPHRRRVEVFIRPPLRSLRNPGGLARAAPPTQGWGWFMSRFSVSHPRQVGPAFRLLKQSYEWTWKAPNGTRGRRRGKRSRQTV